MKVMVTGAAGFIGSHLVESLLDDGHEVVGLDCFVDYYPRAAKEGNLERARDHSAFRFVEGRLQDLDLAPLLEGASEVYHLAAQAGVRSSWGRDFALYSDHNVLATQRVLEAAGDGLPIQLYGDGEQTRDFTFVADIVSATRAAAVSGRPGSVYNVGGGERVALNAVLRTIEQVTGRALRIERQEAQKGDMRDTLADTSAAGRDLGFVSRVPLPEGLRLEWDWIRGQR